MGSPVELFHLEQLYPNIPWPACHTQSSQRFCLPILGYCYSISIKWQPVLNLIISNLTVLMQWSSGPLYHACTMYWEIFTCPLTHWCKIYF